MAQIPRYPEDLATGLMLFLLCRSTRHLLQRKQIAKPTNYCTHTKNRESRLNLVGVTTLEPEFVTVTMRPIIVAAPTGEQHLGDIGTCPRCGKIHYWLNPVAVDVPITLDMTRVPGDDDEDREETTDEVQ